MRLIHGVATLGFLGTSLTGCIFGSNPTCKTYCEYRVDCIPEQVDELYDQDCTWEDGDDDALDDCIAACEDEWGKSSSSEREEVQACVRCIEDETQGSCDLEDFGDALEDCDNECEDDDVEDFEDDVADEWNTDLECSNDGPNAGCTDTCNFAGDGVCDDGGVGSTYNVCALGTDCTDCGPR